MNPPSAYAVLGKQVAFSDIDRELALLSSAGETTIRASLMNIVIFSAQPGSLLENQKIMQSLMAEHACRALLVELNAEAADDSSFAWVTSHCRFQGGSKTVCNEQIAFWLNGHVRGRIPNSVFAHLDSDLPLVFWWQGELTHVFRPRLYKRMNRFLFDSAEWASPGEACRRVAEARRDTYGELVLHDLEWARSFALRMGLSTLFDDPSALDVLSRLDTIRLTYDPAHRMAALLLLTWIVRQTKLSFREFGVSRLTFAAEDRHPVSVYLLEKPSASPLPELSFHAGERSLSLKREGDQPLLLWSRDLPSCRMSRYIPADPLSVLELVGGQLARGGRNTVYNELLDDFLKLWNELEADF